MSKEQNTECPRWNPYQIFVWTIKEMQAWADQCGPWGQWDGKRWRLVSRRIVPGRYEISFKEITDE